MQPDPMSPSPMSPDPMKPAPSVDKDPGKAVSLHLNAADQASLGELDLQLSGLDALDAATLIERHPVTFQADLGYDPSIPRSSWHPGNVWSLHGYHECLVRLGKTEPARIVKQQLDVALARADVEITSSCFCRMTHHVAVD